jgi:hypothetical protein
MKDNPDILCDDCFEFDKRFSGDGFRLDFMTVCNCSEEDVLERKKRLVLDKRNDDLEKDSTN